MYKTQCPTCSTVSSDEGIRFIVLYPPKCSNNLLSLAGLYTRKPFQSPRDIPEQLAAYSAQALSTALLMLGTYFAAWLTEAICLAQGQTKVKNQVEYSLLHNYYKI